MITILCGKSASGKDTTLNKMLELSNTNNPSFLKVEPLISTTSRPMRDGETNGKEYHFVSREEFEKRLADGKFIEHRTYNTLVNNVPDTWYYGMEKQEIDKDKNYIVILDLEGAEAFQRAYGKDNTFTIFIDVCDAVRTQRAMMRGSFDETEWNRRLADDDIKFSEENVNKICDEKIFAFDSAMALVMKVEDAIKERMQERADIEIDERS